VCSKLEEEFDYVLMDCPAGIEQGFKNAVAAAQEAILVTTPEVSSIRDADRVIGLLEASELHRPKLIINRINPSMVKEGNMMDQRDIVDLLAVDVLGLVPVDDRTITAANRGVPVVHDKKSAAGAAFLRIAARVDGDAVPLFQVESKAGLMSRFKGMVGINGSAYSHA
jgi:septum site-determining protein MinD